MIGFDTETTGLARPSATEPHLQPFMIEIYAAKFNDDFEIVDEFEHLLKPTIPISEEITKITGITNDMVCNAPEFIEVYDDLCDFFLGETVVYAHNCTFDIGILKGELARHGLVTNFPWPKDQRCTVELSMPLENKRLTLGKLYKIATGKEIENAHRAKNDVLPMIECIRFLKENGLD
jgi:DNA polymerase III subunit alpha, Gram-positive type